MAEVSPPVQFISSHTTCLTLLMHTRVQKPGEPPEEPEKPPEPGAPEPERKTDIPTMPE